MARDQNIKTKFTHANENIWFIFTLFFGTLWNVKCLFMFLKYLVRLSCVRNILLGNCVYQEAIYLEKQTRILTFQDFSAGFLPFWHTMQISTYLRARSTYKSKCRKRQFWCCILSLSIFHVWTAVVCVLANIWRAFVWVCNEIYICPCTLYFKLYWCSSSQSFLSLTFLLWWVLLLLFHPVCDAGLTTSWRKVAYFWSLVILCHCWT